MVLVAGLQQYVRGLQCSLKWSHPRVMLTELGSLENPLLYRVCMLCTATARYAAQSGPQPAEAMVPCRAARWTSQS